MTAGETARGPRSRRVAVEPPRDPAHGDLATNAAMVLAKPARHDAARRSPSCWPRGSRTLTRRHRGRDRRAGLHQSAPRRRLLAGAACRHPRAPGTAYGDCDDRAGAARSMSNMSRPIRPGRCMSAMAAARWSATRWPRCSPRPASRSAREYYINDAGAQVDALARSLHLRYREALGEAIGAIPEGLYPGDYLKDTAQALAERDGAQWLRRGRGANGWRACPRLRRRRR